VEKGRMGVFIHFYFTYEELKPTCLSCFVNLLGHFYFTYEELKPASGMAIAKFTLDFYFTYEELKQHIILFFIP